MNGEQGVLATGPPGKPLYVASLLGKKQCEVGGNPRESAIAGAKGTASQ